MLKLLQHYTLNKLSKILCFLSGDLIDNCNFPQQIFNIIFDFEYFHFLIFLSFHTMHLKIYTPQN